jgi:ketosteroid isomerase-like protein
MTWALASCLRPKHNGGITAAQRIGAGTKVMQSSETGDALAELDRSRTEALIREFWRLRERDPAAAVRRYMDEDAVYRLFGRPTSYSGPHQFEGQDAIAAAMHAFHIEVELIACEVLDLIVDGRQAALLWKGRFRHRGAGVVGDLVIFEHLAVAEQRIVARSVFLDTDGFQKLVAGEPQTAIARANAAVLGEAMEEVLAASQAAPAPSGGKDATRAFIESFWRDRRRDGSASLRTYCAPDVTAQLIGDPTVIPFAKRYVGLEEIERLVQDIDMEFEFLSFEIIRVLIDGARAAAQWRGELRHRGTNAVAEVEVFDHVVLRDGRIGSFVQFFDTAAAARSIAG